MASSAGGVLFRVVDKAIVALLALLAIVFVGRALLARPVPEVSPADVEARIENLLRKQEASSYEMPPLDKDYLTASIGELRPDIKVSQVELPAPERPVAPPDARQVATVRLSLDEPDETVDVELVDQEWDAAVHVQHPDIVEAQIITAEQVLRLTPRSAGRTQVTLRRADEIIVVVPVTVAPPELRRIARPPRFSVAVQDARARLSWGQPEAVNAEVHEYRLYRRAGDESPVLLLRAVVKDVDLDPEVVPPDGIVLETRAADQTPLPDPVVFKDRTFIYQDRDLVPSVDYEYVLFAVELGPGDEPTVTSEQAGPLPVQVEEPFQIEFITASADRASFYVTTTVPHLDPDQEGEDEIGEPRMVEVRARFAVRPGQPVGWQLSRHVERRPGRSVLRFDEPIDFSTGYRLLDVLPRQTWVRVRAGREYERRDPKALLIDQRGRIKVLWPAHVMEEIRGQADQMRPE